MTEFIPHGSLLEIFQYKLTTSMSTKTPIFPHLFCWEQPEDSEKVDNSRTVGFGLLASPDVTKGLGFVISSINSLSLKECMFSVDRKGLKQHGIEYDRAITVFYFNEGKWKFGVIEYEFDKTTGHKKVKPYNWENEFWTKACQAELSVAQTNVELGDLPPTSVYEGGSPDELLNNLRSGTKSNTLGNVTADQPTIEYPERGAWAALLDNIGPQMDSDVPDPSSDPIFPSDCEGTADILSDACDKRMAEVRPQCIRFSRLKEMELNKCHKLNNQEINHIQSGCEYCSILLPLIDTTV